MSKSFEEQILESGRTYFPLRECSICDESIGYRVFNNLLYFDSSCGCSSSTPDRRPFVSLAQCVTRQLTPETRLEVFSKLGLPETVSYLLSES